MSLREKLLTALAELESAILLRAISVRMESFAPHSGHFCPATPVVELVREAKPDLEIA